MATSTGFEDLGGAPAGTIRRDDKPGTGFEDIPTAAPQQRAPASVVDRVNAGAAGFNSGVAGMLGLPVDTAANVLDLGKAGAEAAYMALKGEAPPVSWDPSRNRSNVPLSGDWWRAHLGSAASLPRPDDTASRYLYAGGSVIPAAALGGATSADSLAAALVNTGKGTAGALPSVAAGQFVSDAKPFKSDAANSTAALTAQLLAGMAPSAAGAATRGLIRGSDPAAMASNVDAFRSLGAEPTLGQASGTRRTQFLESALAKVPGGAGVVQKAAEEQAENLGHGVDNLTTALSPGGASPERAGRAIRQGISGEGGFADRFRQTSNGLFNQVDQYIPANQPVQVNTTLKALNDIAAPLPGAPATSAALVNPKVAQIRQAVMSDLGANGTSLPYAAISGVRSQVGDLLAGGSLISDIPTGQLKRLYGALSSDMTQAAQDAGPAAAQAFSRASNYYSAGLKRMDVLDFTVDKAGGPEAVFNAALSGTKDGATRLRAVMQSLDADQQKAVSATVIKRMGNATPSQQNAAGDVFSPESFLTNWNRMSPEAKSALFDRFGPDFRNQVDNIAQVGSNLRSGSKVFQNRSGTAGAEAQTGMLGHVLESAIGAGAIVGGHGAGISTPHLIVGAGAVPLAAYGAAKATTSPGVVDWAARSTQPGAGAQASLISAPTNSVDQRHQRLANAWSQASQNQAATEAPRAGTYRLAEALKAVQNRNGSGSTP